MSERINSSVNVAKLAYIDLLTPEGDRVQAGKLWQTKPVVFVFLRHFACIGCRGHAKQVWSDREIYEAKGTRIVFVGNGSPNFIDGFKKDLGLEKAVVLTDPSLESFRAAGFHYGFRYSVNISTLKNAMTLYSAGHRQASYKKGAGTLWQLGGLLVVKTNGEVAYCYISESAGDFPDEPHYETIIGEEKSNRSTSI